jgi:hypothetical protein
LSLITHQLHRSQESTSTVDQRLCEIEKTLYAVKEVIQAQPRTISHVLCAASTSSRIHWDSNDNQQFLAWPSSGGFLRPHIERLRCAETSKPQLIPIESRLKDVNAKCFGEYHSTSSTTQHRPEHVLPPHPAGLLELSPNCFPELYTIEEGLSKKRLLVSPAHEKHFAAHTRTKSYCLLVWRLPRQWRRLTLSFTITRQSRYWEYTKVFTSKRNTVTMDCDLPPLFQAQAEKMVAQAEDFSDDTEISLTLTDDGSALNASCWTQTLICVEHHEQSVTELLDHMGCRRYFEKEVAQIAILHAPDCFVSFVEGRFLLENKITLSPTDNSLYMIQLLHCLKGCPGVANLAGVIVDSKGQELKSYLREMPGKGGMSKIISDGLKEGRSIKWS